ncbi:MAG TPA: hypothetical protein VGR70_04230 [Stellaceae bacterium]|nr:hypothetical protein [Stellaceae bacterium]
MPASRPVPSDPVPKYRISLTDVFWVVFLVAWTAFGIDRMIQDVAEYRAEQRAIAAFDARMPKMIGEAPYDPAVGERLIGEAAGCVITLAVVLFGIRRRRRLTVETRVKWVSAPRERVAVAPPTRAAPMPGAKSGSLAADRLSAVVWTDHVARREKEHA